MMQKKTKKKLLLFSPFLLLLLLAMTISDSYYSNLSEHYPVLKGTEPVQGEVTGIIIHHKYTYIELDSLTKRLVPPSFLKSAEPTYFHKAISIGDYFLHETNSKEVTLVKNRKRLNFIVSGLRN